MYCAHYQLCHYTSGGLSFLFTHFHFLFSLISPHTHTHSPVRYTAFHIVHTKGYRRCIIKKVYSMYVPMSLDRCWITDSAIASPSMADVPLPKQKQYVPYVYNARKNTNECN